jgi:phenylalanyl-tRNA synthetase beta chain
MIISHRWLRALAPTIHDSPERLAERLGMLGAPVDEIVALGDGLSGIVIARVEEVRPHPNADRLRICTVSAGGGEPLQVVCGAPNVEGGRYYPFAPIGASLPDGMEIRKAKLRGEVSEGMLCSARELGLGRDHAGLMTLRGEWEPGTSFVEGVDLQDTLLVLDVTPNRPDLLSHLGVARELATGGEADLELPAFAGGGEELEISDADTEGSVAGVRIRIDDASGCSRYMAAVLEGISVAPSPEWLATRLRAIGVRPINNVVDATNYVLHELGQPLHAFDLDRLDGPEVRVRRAQAEEGLRTLDGLDRVLGPGALVIADRLRAIGLAGVMGGEESEVTDGTSRILLECALFDPLTVRKTARSLALSTDASHRFERGVDPEGQPRALRRVVELILTIAGGSVSGPAVDVRTRRPAPVRIAVRPARVRRVLGVTLRGEEIDSLLRPIGFHTEEGADAIRVAVPSYRPDVTREIDLIEEIARRRGYDSFLSDLRPFRAGRVPPAPLLEVQRRLHSLMARWGLYEARTVAFAPASPSRVPLLNPLSAEESHLRDNLVDGLLRRVEHNWAHGVRSIRLYEIGSVFRPGGRVPDEEIHLAAVLTGAASPPHWAGAERAWDVWDLKALAADVAAAFGGVVSVDAHGGQGRLQLTDGTNERIGTAAEVEASRLDAPAWAGPVHALEIVLRPPPVNAARAYLPLPSFPAVERDLALVTPVQVESDGVARVIHEAAGDLLERVWPFDLYEGRGLPEGTRSVAWRLRFRHPDRTLTDEEVEKVVDRTLQALEEEYGVRRR